MKIAIQGEMGSNSHMATLQMLGDVEIVACNVSAEVMAKVVSGEVDGAVLPIENSLHGSVAEHYDLLLELPVRIERESQMHIRHNLIAMPGVKLGEIRRVMSHPVALSQCRRFFASHPEFEAVPFYDTAGSVKHLMSARSARHRRNGSRTGGHRVWRRSADGRGRRPRRKLHSFSPDRSTGRSSPTIGRGQKRTR